MWFEPGFGLLTALLFDSVAIFAEKTRGETIDEYYKKSVDTSNRMLNGSIRSIKEKYGLQLTEMALKQIQLKVTIFHKDFTVQQAHGKLVLEPDNFDYIIALLEKCASDERALATKIYSEGYTKGSEKCREKAEAYQKLVDDVKRAKERRINELKEEAANKELENKVGSTLLGCFAIVVIMLIVFILAL